MPAELPRHQIYEALTADPLHLDMESIAAGNVKSDVSFRGSLSLLRVIMSGPVPLMMLGESKNVGSIYVDAQEGYFIKAEQDGKDPVIVGTLSFLSAPPTGKGGVLLDSDMRVYPRIIQMQGATAIRTDNPNRRKTVMGVLSMFSLEGICVDVATEFAKKKGMSAVGIVPAHRNPNRSHEGFDMERMKRRYDETAIARGFQMTDSGFYVKELLAK